MLRIPDLWTAALARNNLGPASVIRQFIRRATEVGREAVPAGDFVTVREACVVYMLARSNNHSADFQRLECLSGMNGGSVSFVSSSLESKRLVTVERGDSIVINLTDNGRELVRKCRAANAQV
ncbi:hypothetical protein [Bradyrhizobium sp. CCGUVB23]|uniref:hypothetical protein n=1 Tax=Bradyrhizobium sp. CCGUVB23 TaxID=2949630 RepID=UPI0020B3676A|nr:hypothetical protein [Bradyrhizobium sp. CCGUVB23]MCP3460714.1 hypothetical protein [Bradyrhizobium sp. CCGUVB23]